jgi:hypothetical protein
LTIRLPLSLARASPETFPPKATARNTGTLLILAAMTAA